MVDRVNEALALAAKGFWVFPLKAKGKTPAHVGWQDEATRDPRQIENLFSNRAYNVGIFTSRFGDDKALLVIDVDNKKGKNGDAEIFRLELLGNDFQPTYTQFTPTGGRHLVYVVDQPVKQGANVLAPGLDTRSFGGYIVGAGSALPNGLYTADDCALAQAPDWIVQLCGRAVDRPKVANTSVSGVDTDRATRRAIEYLTTEALLSVEGQGGDETTYKVAARVKDFGVAMEVCYTLMEDHWNDRCSPPWSTDDLMDKVINAYRYGTEPVGAADPAADFPVAPPPSDTPPVLSPVEELNKNFAFVIAGGGGNILWETTDPDGNYAFHLLNKATFADQHAYRTITYGKKTEPLTTTWMQSPLRRNYDGLVFEPGRDVGKRWYNMWRGFSVEPADTPTHWALDMWLEHARDNVCGGDEQLCIWLLSWFAHLIQKPYEKPLVAVVFKGKKGTGKNALIERLGKLLNGHFLLTSRRRYITSNFTMHLQKCLMFVMDEAFWSGDKEAEGVVKDLITGDKHVIEPKGKESYSVRNLTRIAVIGNEEWVVPASADERRWAVFNVGVGRQQDRDYFERMRIGLDEGGNKHLLRYLMDYRITADVNNAPKTLGLLEQKLASLEPFEQWWYSCLTDGTINHSDFGEGWPVFIQSETLRNAFARYAKERNIRSRFPDTREIGRLLEKVCPGRKHTRQKSNGPYGEKLPSLQEAREQWDAYLGQPGVWE